MIKNTQNISKIVMRPFAECLCEIGQDWYHIDFEVIFVPHDYYPDYMKVTEFVSKNINGKEMNIEDAVNKLWEMLNDVFNPDFLSVCANVNQSTTHFPVSVMKIKK